MSRRNTELLLLIASAFPVILLYAMYVHRGRCHLL